jgi:hypothetical protein
MTGMGYDCDQRGNVATNPLLIAVTMSMAIADYTILMKTLSGHVLNLGHVRYYTFYLSFYPTN